MVHEMIPKFGLRKTRTKAELKSDLIATARQLFLQRGIEQVSVSDIGLAVGVSKPTVYSVFESKQALVAAVFNAALADTDLGWTENALQSTITFSDFLDHARNTFLLLKDLPQASEVYQLVMRDGPHNPELVASFSEIVVVPSTTTLRAIIGQAMDKGECRRMDDRVVHNLIIAPWYFLMSNRAVFGSGGMQPDVAKLYLDASFASLKTFLCGSANADAGDVVHDNILKRFG